MSDTPFKFIVLHSFKHKESGIVVKGYSLENGKESLFLRGAGKKNSKNSLSLLHPLSLINVVTSSRTFGEMKTIKEFEAMQKLSSVRSNIDKIAIAIFISEIISITLREKEQDKAMFDFLENTILDLEKIKSGTSNFHLLFLIRHISMLGYMPDITRETGNLLFDIPSAGFNSTSGTYGQNNHTFREEESDLLKTLSEIQPQHLSTIRISRESRFNFITGMLRYLSYHAGYQIKCESLQVLHEVFE